MDRDQLEEYVESLSDEDLLAYLKLTKRNSMTTRLAVADQEWRSRRFGGAS